LKSEVLALEHALGFIVNKGFSLNHSGPGFSHVVGQARAQFIHFMAELIYGFIAHVVAGGSYIPFGVFTLI
jgi:hypothetical protein